MTAQQIRVIENRAYLEESLRELLPHGYKCYTLKAGRLSESTSEPYGYIITPGGNILCASHQWFGGWNFTFMYLRTRENGVGCQCLEKAADDMSLETVKRAELEGRGFAFKLKAHLYSSPEAWMRGYWDRDSLVPVAPAVGDSTNVTMRGAVSPVFCALPV